MNYVIIDNKSAGLFDHNETTKTKQIFLTESSHGVSKNSEIFYL